MAKKIRVLVIDDQILVTKFIEIDLKNRGYEPYIANSGNQALVMVKSLKPDILLLDILMPAMSGIEVLKELRQFSDVPVIAFSACSANRCPALLAGASDFMLKPFDPVEIIKKIETLIQ